MNNKSAACNSMFSGLLCCADSQWNSILLIPQTQTQTGFFVQHTTMQWNFTWGLHCKIQAFSSIMLTICCGFFFLIIILLFVKLTFAMSTVIRQHRFSQKWQLRVCKWNFMVCKMSLLMKIPMKMKKIRVTLGCAIGLIACAKHRCTGGWLKLCQARAFIFDSWTDVCEKVSKILRQKSRPMVE